MGNCFALADHVQVIGIAYWLLEEVTPNVVVDEYIYSHDN